MAAKVLDDILNNFLSLDVLLGWLSNKCSTGEEKIFLEQYQCSQIEFVSYFLGFVREQSSRDFQIYDAETPRKNSHSRGMKVSNTTTEKSSPQLNFQQEFSPVINNLDLDSQHSFPSLSSCSSKIGSHEKKLLGAHLNHSEQDKANKMSCERKFRRVKLFSETVESNLKGSNFNRKEVEFLEDVDFKHVCENKFTVSTPKQTGNNSLPIIDYFNTSDTQEEFSPKLGSKSKWKTNSLDLSSPEISFSAIKSRSFTGDQSHRSKENKVNCKLSLGDFILNDISPNDNKKDKKSKTKKRINPVKVVGQSVININSPFSEKSEESEEQSSTAVEEKALLKVDIEKNVLDEDKDNEPVRLIMNSQVEKQAELESATYTNELKLLSQIYSCLINENYCQNIMIELCFIISLLVIQEYNKKMTDLELDVKNFKLVREKNFFCSIHNCVYFAVETLWLQRNLLFLLNLSALKLLSENIRIEKFNMQLKEFLVNACCKKKNEEIKRHNELLKTAMQGNVSFQYETDNRENFTSNANFHSFRKQRDLFYNILAIWEANRLVSGWSFSVGLGSKIRNLLAISSDPINLLHLSRLFRNQLIMSCCGENQAEEDLNEDILQLLPTADPNRILRLRARLTSSPKRQGPCPLPDFNGYQEFYKDFILCTSHSIFHEHLKNSLCDEILRLNETELIGDVDDNDSCLDEQTQESYLQRTNILRLLAKFLGFVEFLPYRGEKQISDRVLNIHCSVRLNTLPLFDVVSCLKSALKKQRLTLTIPWLVSYLSMIDPYSARLKAYQNVWHLLILIYKQLKTYKKVKNSFYLKLTLGWMFQLPNFPPDQFYTVLDEFNKTPGDSIEISFSNEAAVGLDSYDFVGETILYIVCPYLNELNVILSENLGCSVRHIRPVTTQENSVTKLQASKQLELRLESNFLHNQSSSTRKTVEFVTERVASIVIKHLIHNVIPKIKEAAWTRLENFSSNDLKEAEAESEALSESCYKELLTICEKENWEISCKRSEVALRSLLSSDLQESIVKTCAKIVTRQATERVQRWMDSHVTLAMIKAEFATLTKKRFTKKDHNNSTLEGNDVFLSQTAAAKDTHRLPPDGRGLVHDEEAWPASQTLKTVRELIWKLYEGGSSAQQVEEVIEVAMKTIKKRRDVIPAAEKAVFSLIVDLIVCFCALSGGDVSQEILNKFLQLLKSLGYQNSWLTSLEKIICPRNIGMILNEAKNKKKAWGNLGKFLLFLAEEDILTKEQIESQLLSLLRQNWEKEDGLQFSKFISQILNSYSKKNGCDKFSLLLEYMIDTLNDDEPKSESFG